MDTAKQVDKKFDQKLMERRRSERRSSVIRVEMFHPSWGVIHGLTKDISDGGAQIQFENAIAPPLGTEVHVKFKKIVGSINLEPVKMRVVHSTRGKVGLMFLPR